MRPSRTFVPALAMLVLAPGATRAEEVVGEARAVADAPFTTRNFGNLRVGGSTANGNRRPELCLELSPVSFLSVEGCGTGSGFLHGDPEPEVAHFRAKLRLMSFEKEGWGTLQPFLAAGLAEAQVGEDEPGLQITGTDARRVATAGPELGLGLRFLRPLASGFELVGDFNVGMAWLPHGPDLVEPVDTWLPSASLSFGLGF
ncbi:hypothetical protein HPC49_16300 [Pyxidicoccus fallax]|uniref:Outer membrane protein beta-barrel domain-containing protein n=1 Tax=Pyxidicoccus fallax TaxID=394095 RepID=A0A848LDP2_9BACT|nr:hypothetical protein [Pyxidicoccus fallax]NMO17139.1 hypothetical protein [Pyxidicoccus fallax]NPC79780.1 hypothetical protein [Pyxidicoccus fallax]